VELFYKKLGEKLCEARQKQGFSGDALGAKLKLGRASISNIEKGRQKLSLDQALLLFEELGISFEEIRVLLKKFRFEEELQLHENPHVRSIYKRVSGKSHY
jgi:transcriptional regulator with XRE-family HTH domain